MSFVSFYACICVGSSANAASTCGHSNRDYGRKFTQSCNLKQESVTVLSNTTTGSVAPVVPQASSLPLERGDKCECSENESSGSAVVAVSAVSLLLIVTLTTVTLTQCLLIIRMRRSRDRVSQATNTPCDVTASKKTDVSCYTNEAYELHKVSSVEEVIYELV